jgi:hypothetical protein
MFVTLTVGSGGPSAVDDPEDAMFGVLANAAGGWVPRKVDPGTDAELPDAAGGSDPSSGMVAVSAGPAGMAAMGIVASGVVAVFVEQPSTTNANPRLGTNRDTGMSRYRPTLARLRD